MLDLADKVCHQNYVRIEIRLLTLAVRWNFNAIIYQVWRFFVIWWLLLVLSVSLSKVSFFWKHFLGRCGLNFIRTSTYLCKISLCIVFLCRYSKIGNQILYAISLFAKSCNWIDCISASYLVHSYVNHDYPKLWWSSRRRIHVLNWDVFIISLELLLTETRVRSQVLKSSHWLFEWRTF